MSKYKTIEEVLSAEEKQRKHFIKDLIEDEKNRTVQNENVTENEIKAIEINTELKKQSFINEIKNGLGDEIRFNNEIKVIKQPMILRLKSAIVNFFLKF